jgi:apolipoprotein N-acyltransferase
MTQKHISNPPISDRWSYLWLVVSAVLVFFTYGMYRIPLAGLLAYVFLIRFMRSRNVGVGYLFTNQTVDTPYGRLAGVVCCDLDYPYVIRQVSQKGVDILLVPSFEPTTANIVAHSQMAPFRAIENGVSIFRPTSQGISLAIDPYGRLLGSMNHTTASETVLVAQVPNRHIFTIYSAVGDLFGWLTVAGFVLMVGWAILRGRRAGKEGQNAAH